MIHVVAIAATRRKLATQHFLCVRLLTWLSIVLVKSILKDTHTAVHEWRWRYAHRSTLFLVHDGERTVSTTSDLEHVFD